MNELSCSCFEITAESFYSQLDNCAYDSKFKIEIKAIYVYVLSVVNKRADMK